MSERKHTPGPWKWDSYPMNYDPEQDAPWLIGEKGERILSGEITAHNEADVALLSSAPELFDAVNELLMAVSCLPPEVQEYAVLIHAVRQARNAVNQATN